MMKSSTRFEALIENHHDEIYRYLWRMLNNAGRSDSRVEAQDLTQEVFMRAFRGFKQLRRDSCHRAWLYKIATNCAYTALKQGQRQAHHSVPFADEILEIPAAAHLSPDQQVVIGETLEAIQQSISVLPPKQKAAVVLRHVQSLSYPEIAQALGCSEDSARANVYQGLRRLRRELGEELKGEDGWTSDS
jgi:RNA polymerase sigma-70 factor (ECF subfamily)